MFCRCFNLASRYGFSIDLFIQYFLGENILGYKYNDNYQRASGFFNDENIAGSFLFFTFVIYLSYTFAYKYDEKKPLEEQINDAIEWGYNNDELGDFYNEYRYELEESECIILVQSCNMKHNIAYTSVDLFRFNSNNKYYYIIQADGDFADLIDADSFYEVLDTQDDESIIDYFKNICNNAYDIDGEILDDDLNESSIEFLENY